MKEPERIRRNFQIEELYIGLVPKSNSKVEKITLPTEVKATKGVIVNPTSRCLDAEALLNSPDLFGGDTDILEAMDAYNKENTEREFLPWVKENRPFAWLMILSKYKDKINIYLTLGMYIEDEK